MNFSPFKLFQKLNSLPKRRKLMISLLVMSVGGAMAGAFLKIHDNPNGDYLLVLAIIFQIAGIIGLLSKWSTYLTQSEAIAIKNRH
ncbi:MAG: hypothetical protein PSV36_16215 [Algoriphagus sp.]|nr:hypothetical protein [Algoriphagus sp.]